MAWWGWALIGLVVGCLMLMIYACLIAGGNADDELEAWRKSELLKNYREDEEL